MATEELEADISVGTGILADFGRIEENTEQLFREFIDNSTTSFEDHKKELKKIDGCNCCEIQILWESEQITIQDNAYGMDEESFRRSLRLSAKAKNYSDNSRGQYGLGLKYAAANLGDWYKIESVELGSGVKYSAIIDVDDLKENNPDKIKFEKSDTHTTQHGTLITIRKLKKSLDTVQKKKKGKKKEEETRLQSLIKNLSLVYSTDLQSGDLKLSINGIPVKYIAPEIMQDSKTGREIMCQFEESFTHNNVKYEFSGWICCLKTASVSGAGLTMMQKKRAVEIHYRPEAVFGKSNSFKYQRVFGEVFLKGKNWIVTFTKDAVKWGDTGLEEAFIERLMSINDVKAVLDYAQSYRKNQDLVKPDVPTIFKHYENITVKSDPLVLPREELKKTASPVEPVTDEEETKPIVFCLDGKNYTFYVESRDDDTHSWLQVEVADASKDIYKVYVNSNVSLFQNYKNAEAKKLLVDMAVAVALAQLNSVKDGIKINESKMFIKNINEVLRNAGKPSENEEK